MSFELNELRYIAVVDENIPKQIISWYPEHQLHLLAFITSVSIISLWAV